MNITPAGELISPALMPPSLQDRKINSERTRIKASTQIDDSSPTIKYGQSDIAYKGELIALVGSEGCGKTAASNVHIAGAIAPDEYDGFEMLEIAKNINSGAVLHFETEQSPRRQRKAIRDNLKRSDINGDGPDCYESHSLLEEDDIMSAIEERAATAFETHGSIHLIVIDGGAECCTNTNELEPSKEAVQRQKKLAEKYNAVVLVIVHTNPGSDKPRGHYGSELLRMAASVLLVKQDDDDVSTISPVKLRHAGKKDCPNIQFIYSQEKGYHVSAGTTRTISKKEAKALKQVSDDDDLINKIFPFGTTLSYDKALQKIRVEAGCSVSYSATIFTRLKKTGRIQESGDVYHIKTAGQ